MAGTELPKKILHFGMDEGYIAKLTEANDGTFTYDELVRVEGIQSLKATEVSNEYTLPGDNGTIDVRSQLEALEIEMTNGALTLENLKIMRNGTIVEEKTGEDVTSRTYVTTVDDKPSYFGFIGVVKSSNSFIIIPKVKAINVDIPFANLSYAICTMKGKAIKRDKDGVMRLDKQLKEYRKPTIEDFKVPTATV